MSAFYWLGFALGLLLTAGVPAAVVLLLAVRPLRRWWLRPLLRLVTGRTAKAAVLRDSHIAELIGELSKTDT